MRHIISAFIVIVILFPGANAFAASADMHVSAKVVNLTNMPVKKAVAFCSERDMRCSALREKYEEKRDAQTADTVMSDPVKSDRYALNDNNEIIYYGKGGYYIK